jgi:hypothetical protein
MTIELLFWLLERVAVIGWTVLFWVMVVLLVLLGISAAWEKLHDWVIAHRGK